MFSEEIRKEFLDDGLTESEIDILENAEAVCNTVANVPEDLESFIEEIGRKIPDDTVNGMKAIAYAAKNDPEFFVKLMSLGFVMSMGDNTPQQKQQDVLPELTDEEYKRASDNYFKTLASLSDSERKEFLKLIANITPEQKSDMIERLKNQ